MKKRVGRQQITNTLCVGERAGKGIGMKGVWRVSGEREGATCEKSQSHERLNALIAGHVGARLNSPKPGVNQTR